MHGIKTNLLLTGARPILGVAMAVIGLVATATDADAAVFPLNKPALVTDVRAAIADAGVQGTLAKSLEAIAAQCSPIIVVVRVAEGVDGLDTDTTADLETEANVVGNAGAYTGVHALLAAEAQLGVRPRILGAPGLDTQAVTAALVTVAQSLRGFVYASCRTGEPGLAIADTAAKAITYRDEFAARELMLLYPDFTGGFPGKAVATALGTRARIDEETGWHKTLSNVAVNGVTGISLPVHFDLQDGSTDAGLLNDAPVTTMVRMNGFRFWGNRTTSDEPLWAFESAVRTSQALQDEIATGLAWAVDKPTNPSLIRDVLETINARFRSLTVQGRLIGGRAWFDPASNSAVDLAAGKVAFDYDFTPCAPAEGITLNQRITSRYYGSIAAQV